MQLSLVENIPNGELPRRRSNKRGALLTIWAPRSRRRNGDIAPASHLGRL